MFRGNTVAFLVAVFTIIGAVQHVTSTMACTQGYSDCKKDPCASKVCERYPEAQCKTDFCGGCNARFFQRIGLEVQEVTRTCQLVPKDCPDDKPRIFCFANPCTGKNCERYPKAICKADFCGGCNARFFQTTRSEVKEVTQSCRRAPGECPIDKPKHSCVDNLCIKKTCERYPKAICRANFCGGCNAQFFLRDGSEERGVTQTCRLVPRECPADRPRNFCFVNPCNRKTCERYPKAICKADYCGGCNARFFQRGVSEVQEVTQTCRLVPRECPKDKPRNFCFVNPCRQGKCGRFPTAICKADYCGGCNARFFLRGASEVREVTKSCRLVPRECPDDKPRNFCFVNPCRGAICERYPKAICKADYCGGCNARFFQRKGLELQEVTQTCQLVPRDCPKDKPKNSCLRNPCRRRKCERYPLAICKADYCGGCNARYFQRQKSAVREVTKTCELVPKVCPIDKPRYKCKANPCRQKRCGKYSRPFCKPDYCGGCTARFFIFDGKTCGYKEV